jgi:hypothetical protein
MSDDDFSTLNVRMLFIIKNRCQICRLYTCEQCRRYIRTIDLRQVPEERILSVERILTLPLDMAARDGLA